MSKHKLVFLQVLLLAAIGSASAQDTGMRFFVGTWDFRIWSTADVSGPPAFTGTWFLENGLDSALALEGRVMLDDGAGVQGGLFTRELIAYDALVGSYQRTIVTNTGACYLFASEGWKGDTLIWTGWQHTASGEMDLREEIVRTGPDSFTAVFHRKDGDAWVLQSNERLTRKR